MNGSQSFLQVSTAFKLGKSRNEVQHSQSTAIIKEISECYTWRRFAKPDKIPESQLAVSDQFMPQVH